MNRQQRRQSRRQDQGAAPGSDDDESASNFSLGVDLTDDEFDTPATTATPSRTAPPSRQHTGPRQFLHEVNVEMRKVAWPTRSETLNYSTVVFVTLAVLMALIFVLDLGFTHVAGFLFNP